MPSKLQYVPWKKYSLAVAETILAFTLAGLILGYYFIKVGNQSLAMTISLCVICAMAVLFSLYRMVRKFSLAANMLMIPIAPLVILIIVVALLQVFELWV